MRSLLSLVVSVQTLGCSFALVKGPPTNYREQTTVECTTSRVGPILDAAWTGLNILEAILIIPQDDYDWEDTWEETWGLDEPLVSRGTGILLHSLFAAAGAAGMWWGFTRTNRCRDAKAELAARPKEEPRMLPKEFGTWPADPQQPPPPPQPAPEPAPPLPAPTP